MCDVDRMLMPMVGAFPKRLPEVASVEPYVHNASGIELNATAHYTFSFPKRNPGRWEVVDPVNGHPLKTWSQPPRNWPLSAMRPPPAETERDSPIPARHNPNMKTELSNITGIFSLADELNDRGFERIFHPIAESGRRLGQLVGPAYQGDATRDAHEERGAYADGLVYGGCRSLQKPGCCCPAEPKRGFEKETNQEVNCPGVGEDPYTPQR